MPATTRRRTWDKCLLDAPQDFKEVKKKFTENKSWFEERREENLKANAAFLASLNINDAKLKLKPKVEPKSLSSRGIKTKSVMEPRTYELRPVRRPVTRSSVLPEDGESQVMLSTCSQPRSESSNRGVGPVSLDTMQNTAQITAPVISWEDCIVPKGCSYSQTLTNRLAASCGPKPSVTEDLVDFVNICSLMSINSNLVAKVTPHRIYSIDLHSSLHNSPLVAAGDKWGHVGLWNVIPEKSSANDGVCLFKPHVSPVNCVKFSDYDQSTLFSSSYDGTVRRCDVNKQQFELVYSTPDEDDIQHMYLSEVDMNRVCVASTDSCIAYIDSRTSSVRSFDTQSGKLKCVSHHPIEKHYFITASVKGHVDLWDERYLAKSRSYLARLPHKKGVLSAFFSPTSGEKILSCSAGDEIKVYNSTDMTNIETESSFYHNNFTGRWLSNFRATWHPSREDCFLIGSMKHPRQIDLIGCDGKLLHTFHDNGDLLQSVTSLNAFHPSLPFMAGGNSSGRVFVFMAQMDCL